MQNQRINAYTVGQVNSYINNLLQRDFLLRQIAVKGEVSNCKYHPSGHIYFSLKDRTGVLPAVMFAGDRTGLRFTLEEGQSVIVTGSVSVYEKGGRYQLYAKRIVLEGAGDLYAKLEALKKKLAEMGMFDEMYKKPVPKYAKSVGIVTASTGAAIRDIVNIAARRNPYCQLILYPATVQGDAAAPSIVRGIRTLDRSGVDVIIIGRGGGSIEDLWAFNTEEVARAVFDCETPVISAVGHETDVTISDFAADLRAPTPSAAAELAVCDIRTLLGELSGYEGKLRRAMGAKADSERYRIQQYRNVLMRLHPRIRIEKYKKETGDRHRDLSEIMYRKLSEEKNRAALLAGRLETLSPLARLKGGYAFVTDADGNSLLSAGQVRQGDEIDVTVRDGSIRASVKEVRTGPTE